MLANGLDLRIRDLDKLSTVTSRIERRVLINVNRAYKYQKQNDTELFEKTALAAYGFLMAFSSWETERGHIKDQMATPRDCIQLNDGVKELLSIKV